MFSGNFVAPNEGTKSNQWHVEGNIFAASLPTNATEVYNMSAYYETENEN